MKYKFSSENDVIKLTYKDKEFTFKRNVKYNTKIFLGHNNS